MATFDIEHRINRRLANLNSPAAAAAPASVEQAPVKMITGSAGRIDASALRRGPQLPTLKGSTLNTDFNSEFGLEAPASEPAGAPAAAGARRRLAPSRQEGNASARGAYLSGNSLASERERQGMRKEIDSALFSLRSRGGGLNMRSKRQLFGDLLSRKADLTSEAYRTQNQRDVEGARLANDTAQSNAALAERGADRRGRTNMFYDELNEDSRIKDERLSIDRKSAAANDNYLDMLIKDAKAQRDSERYALERRGTQDKYDDERIDTLASEFIKAGADPSQARSQARQQLAIDLADTNQPIDTTQAAVGARDYAKGVASNLSQDRGPLRKLAEGDNPFNAAPAVNWESYPLDELQVSPTGIAPGDLIDWAIPGYAVPDYQITGPVMNGQRVKQTFGSEKEALDAMSDVQRASRLRRALRDQ